MSYLDSDMAAYPVMSVKQRTEKTQSRPSTSMTRRTNFTGTIKSSKSQNKSIRTENEIKQTVNNLQEMLQRATKRVNQSNILSQDYGMNFSIKLIPTKQRKSSFKSLNGAKKSVTIFSNKNNNSMNKLAAYDHLQNIRFGGALDVLEQKAIKQQLLQRVKN